MGLNEHDWFRHSKGLVRGGQCCSYVTEQAVPFLDMVISTMQVLRFYLINTSFYLFYLLKTLSCFYECVIKSLGLLNFPPMNNIDETVWASQFKR